MDNSQEIQTPTIYIIDDDTSSNVSSEYISEGSISTDIGNDTSSEGDITDRACDTPEPINSNSPLACYRKEQIERNSNSVYFGRFVTESDNTDILNCITPESSSFDSQEQFLDSDMDRGRC